MTKAKRGKAQGKSWYPEPALVRKRVAEMTRAYESSFPDRQLPNNGLGRKWAKYMIRTKRIYPSSHDYLWLKNWCPWMNESDQDEILGLKGHWYTTGSLGARLEIDNAMRQDLALWTMRPDDVEWEQVQLEQKKREYMKTQEKRRARGVKARRKGAAEPWKARGMSKATFYRKKLHLVHETPESALISPVGRADSQVSPSQPERPALAGSNVITFPKKARRRKQSAADTAITTWASGRPMGIHRTSAAEPKPFLKLVWSQPSPEQVARMADAAVRVRSVVLSRCRHAELQRGYVCTAVEPTATELDLAA